MMREEVAAEVKAANNFRDSVCDEGLVFLGCFEDSRVPSCLKTDGSTKADAKVVS